MLKCFILVPTLSDCQGMMWCSSFLHQRRPKAKPFILTGFQVAEKFPDTSKWTCGDTALRWNIDFCAYRAFECSLFGQPMILNGQAGWWSWTGSGSVCDWTPRLETGCMLHDGVRTFLQSTKSNTLGRRLGKSI